jgi:hypothetical protein
MTALVSDLLLRGKFDEMDDADERMGTEGISGSPKLCKQMATLYGIL